MLITHLVADVPPDTTASGDSSTWPIVLVVVAVVAVALVALGLVVRRRGNRPPAD